MLSGSTLSFGLARFSSSEFELVADELSMDDSAVKVFQCSGSDFLASVGFWFPHAVSLVRPLNL